MKKPLFSVITVVFNDERKINKTIESVVSQKNKSFEYIIIDGGSTDATLSIVQNYADKITQILSESDEGIYQAMNKGVRLANGEYIIFMNSGDTFVNADILNNVQSSFGSSQFDVVYGDVLKFDAEGTLQTKRSEPPKNSHRMYFCHQSVFVKTELLNKLPFDEKYKMSADFKFFKQAYNQGLIFYQLHFPTTIFDQTGISKQQRVKGLKENIEVIKECDKGLEKLRLLARIYPSYLSARLRQ